MNDLQGRVKYWIERIEIYQDLDYVCPEFTLRELKAILKELKYLQSTHSSNLDFMARQFETRIYGEKNDRD